MRKGFSIWLSCIIISMLILGSMQTVHAETTKAPDFTLKDLAGNKVSLSKYKGKKVYVNFWATWCGYCVQEMPDLEKITKENKDGKLVVLAVNVGESQKVVSKFIKKKAYTFKVLLDLKSTVSSDLYGVNGYPTSVFINSDGTISKTVVGMMSYEEMKAEIAKLK